MAVTSYRNLTVWQKAMQLVIAIYDLTGKLPESERYGLVSQMRRASVSIPSNIAERKMRGTRKDYRHFLLDAFGSGAELETQLEIVKNLSLGRGLSYDHVDSLLAEVMRMLNALIHKLEITVPNT